MRGNGKIIQELETDFRGAGWNVIKVIWGNRWDPLLAADHDGLLVRRMEEAVDGDYQTYKSRDGAYVREHFFGGATPSSPTMVEDMVRRRDLGAQPRRPRPAEGLRRVRRRGRAHQGQPTVILAKTIKGYGMGEAGEGQNITHQQKKMNEKALFAFRDRFELDLTDDEVQRGRVPQAARRLAGDGVPARAPRGARRQRCPQRVTEAPSRCRCRSSSAFKGQLEGTGEREISTTMAFVRILAALVRDKELGRARRPDRPRRVAHVRHGGDVPPARDLQPGRPALPAARTRDQLMFYREDKTGQILQEGINEPGAFSSWIAAATSYANHGVPMMPFYIYYSMFGFQRVGDLAWAAGDSRARGFLLGGTAGRTTLNGEGLQHEDGHRHIQASLIPNCVSYDPAYAYEVAVIVQDGLRRMLAEQEDVFYYLTLMNENYRAAGDAGGRGGGDPARDAPRRARPTARDVQLLGLGHDPARGARRRRAAARRTSASRPTCGASRRSPSCAATAMEAERWNRLHPGEEPRASCVERALGGSDAPGRRRDRLHPRASPTRSARRSTRRTRCSAPTASGAATTASALRALLRGRPPPRRRRRAARARRRRGRGEGDRAVRHRHRRGGAMAEVTEVDRPRHRGLHRRRRSIEVLVAPGDEVAEDDPLVTLESDKATMDVPAPLGGRRAGAAGEGRRQGVRGHGRR